MKETKLNTYLESLGKSELKKEILELFKLYPEVEEHYSLKVNFKLEEALFEKYKRRIDEEFLTNREKYRYSAISEAIIEFQQISSVPSYVAHLMFYYIYTALDNASCNSNVEENFCISIEGAFHKALNLIFKNRLEEEFQEIIDKLMKRVNVLNLELKDNISEIYFQYY